MVKECMATAACAVHQRGRARGRAAVYPDQQVCNQSLWTRGITCVSLHGLVCVRLVAWPVTAVAEAEHRSMPSRGTDGPSTAALVQSCLLSSWPARPCVLATAGM